MESRDTALLAASIAPCQTFGFAGSLGTRPPARRYASLATPCFSPRSWVVAPVRIARYLTMGASLMLVWRRGRVAPGRRDALPAFFLPFGLNALWSPAFFGLRSTGVGLAVIVALLAAVAVTMQRFGRISRAAAWLLVPYLLWTGLAAVLNLSRWLLNR